MLIIILRHVSNLVRPIQWHLLQFFLDKGFVYQLASPHKFMIWSIENVLQFVLPIHTFMMWTCLVLLFAQVLHITNQGMIVSQIVHQLTNMRMTLPELVCLHVQMVFTRILSHLNVYSNAKLHLSNIIFPRVKENAHWIVHKKLIQVI